MSPPEPTEAHLVGDVPAAPTLVPLDALAEKHQRRLKHSLWIFPLRKTSNVLVLLGLAVAVGNDMFLAHAGVKSATTKIRSAPDPRHVSTVMFLLELASLALNIQFMRDTTVAMLVLSVIFNALSAAVRCVVAVQTFLAWQDSRAGLPTSALVEAGLDTFIVVLGLCCIVLAGIVFGVRPRPKARPHSSGSAFGRASSSTADAPGPMSLH